MNESAASTKRVKGCFAELIWAQVRPWAYLDTDGVDVRAFDGRPMSFSGTAQQGVREAMWQDYIDPFLKDLCRREIVRAKAEGIHGREIHDELFRGIVRTYWVMADIHRLYWPLPNVTRVDTSHEVDTMMAFIDAEIASSLKAVA